MRFPQLHMTNERPRAGIEYPGTWPSFEAWFPDDAACREYLARLRWPDGFVCPRCASGDFWTTGRGLWMLPVQRFGLFVLGPFEPSRVEGTTHPRNASDMMSDMIDT